MYWGSLQESQRKLTKNLGLNNKFYKKYRLGNFKNLFHEKTSDNFDYNSVGLYITYQIKSAK